MSGGLTTSENTAAVVGDAAALALSCLLQTYAQLILTSQHSLAERTSHEAIEAEMYQA